MHITLSGACHPSWCSLSAATDDADSFKLSSAIWLRFWNPAKKLKGFKFETYCLKCFFLIWKRTIWCIPFMMWWSFGQPGTPYTPMIQVGILLQFLLWNWLLAKGENKQKEVGAYPLKNTLQYNVVSHFFLKNLGLFLHLFLLFSNKQY